MKADTQAVHLEKLMQEKKGLVSYKLALPLCKVLHTDIKTLSKNSILLLGLEHLECILISKENIMVHLKYLKGTGILQFEVVATSKMTQMKCDVEKYARVSLILKSIEITNVDIKTIITIEAIDFMHVEVCFDGVSHAEGKFVTVDETLAIQITKVTKNET